VDLNWYGIWILKKLGLARQVYHVRLSKLPARPALLSPITTLNLAASSSSTVSGD
jgi:hypothetical protein